MKKSFLSTRLKRKMLIHGARISFLFFVILLAEGICGIIMNNIYKSQRIYGKNTYVASIPWGCNRASYGDFKKTGLNLSDYGKYELVTEQGTDIDDYSSRFCKIEEDGMPKDSDILMIYKYWDDYFYNIFFEKYKEHMYFFASINASTPDDQPILYSYIYGPESLIKRGKMCKKANECVVFNGHKIGDRTAIIADEFDVVGKIDNIEFMPMGGSCEEPPFALYQAIGYYHIMKQKRIYRSIESFEADRQEWYSYQVVSEFVFDKSKVSAEDLEGLYVMADVKSLKEAYGRYATAYVYAFFIFPSIAMVIFVLCVRRLLKKKNDLSMV